MALTAARAEMERASNAYFIDTAHLSTKELEVRGAKANETQQAWLYLDQVYGRIERETKRRTDRNAKILSRKSAAASRPNAQDQPRLYFIET